MFRLLGLLFGMAFFIRVFFDFQYTVMQGRSFRLIETGQVWRSIHKDSLLQLQPAVERYLSPSIWESVSFPVLTAPLAPLLAILSIFFLIAGARKPVLR